MIIPISGQLYRLDTSVMTAIRYRIAYGRSCLDAFIEEKRDVISDIDEMAKLIYVAIEGEKPPIYQIAGEFCNSEGKLFQLFANFYKELLRRNKPDTKTEEEQPEEEIQNAESKKTIDEYELFCTYIAMGLPYEFIKELPLFEFAKIIQTMADVKRGKSKEARPLDKSERGKIYSITPEDEERIKAYLNEKR